jgi:hypothetical protein
MSPRELIVLSPYRLPAKNSLMLGNDDVAALLNGYTALWHPAALHGASGPPRIASPYDYEQPTAGHVYAVPESPPLILPDDWDQRVLDAGAAAFRSSPDREATLANLRQALRSLAERAGEGGELFPELAAEQVAPFLGIGFGYAHVEALFEAMEHDNVLATAELWQDVQAAVAAVGRGDAEASCGHLQSAADRLMAAREVLYPVTVHLVDIGLLDDSAPDQPLPAAFDRRFPVNLVASAALLQNLGREHPERLAAIGERFRAEQAEVCGGVYLEREDALLPVESQLWNLLKGLAVSRELLGKDLRVFARRRFAAHPQLPLLLASAGLTRALLLVFDDAYMPTFRTTVVNWPSPNGKQVEAFTRTPYHADDPQTYFHVAHYLHRTIMQDHAATLALLHRGSPAAPWYRDWLELTRFRPVLGRWVSLTQYFNEVMAGEQAAASSADEFHADYLSERTNAHRKDPVSGFARHVRLRRHLDTGWTLAALYRGLVRAEGSSSALSTQHSALLHRLADLEDRVEAGAEPEEELAAAQQEAAEALAGRLLARAADANPGYLVLNPCSFARRVALELDGVQGPLPVGKPIKACQLDGDKARLVVEVPALGFAWIPQASAPGTPPAPARMRLADARHVRNEFFEAEIDPATGGLRGLTDPRTGANRLGQQLVFNPGSTMRATAVKVTSTGPALGEVVSEGAVLGDQDQVLATYRQRFRAWLGRPVLDLRIEIDPERPPEGYPWHAYYGARFAWRDERAVLLRGVNGTGYVTSYTRPETPDYLELRLGRQNTVLFPGGLPFHQRHGTRMLDVILLPEGETCRAFELALGLDREHPMQTALGMVTPVPLVATTKGPPHVGAAGWLFHLDAPNLLLTGLRPAPDGADAVTARLLECASYGGQAELRCPRDPQRAVLLDSRGEVLMEASTSGDAAAFEVAAGDLVQLRVEFG